MLSKTNLFEKIRFLDSAIQDQIVVDKSVSNSNHNGRANLIRKGLGVISFNIIEDYIKQRTSEALDELPRTGISFFNLSEALQTNSSLDALGSLKAKVAQRKKNDSSFDWLTYAHTETAKIASPLSTSSYQLSHYSFLYGASNVRTDDVNSVLNAFAIKGGWGTLSKVSAKCGTGVLDLKQTYMNISDRRHKAAHESGTMYQYSWLENIKNEMLAICSAYDITLSTAIRVTRNNVMQKMSPFDIIPHLKLRYIVKKNNIYQEKTNMTGTSIKNWDSLSNAIASVSLKCIAKNEVLIIHDLNQTTLTSGMSDWRV